jgi:hypothetical protein
MENAQNEWQNKSFKEKAIPMLRVHAGEYIGSGGQQMRLLGHVFDKAGHLLPEKLGGPAVGKALAYLCDQSGKGLNFVANKVRGGYKIEGLPKAAQYLPSMWKAVGDYSEKAMNFLTPERINDALSTYGDVAGALKKIKPDLNLPVLTPAMAMA